MTSTTTSSTVTYPNQAPITIYTTTNSDGTSSISTVPPTSYSAPPNPAVSVAPVPTTSTTPSIIQQAQSAVTTTETAINNAAASLMNAINPPVSTATAQSPSSTSGLAGGSSGVLNSLVTWVKNNPLLAAAAGLTITAAGYVIAKDVLGGSSSGSATIHDAALGFVGAGFYADFQPGNKAGVGSTTQVAYLIAPGTPGTPPGGTVTPPGTSSVKTSTGIVHVRSKSGSHKRSAHHRHMRRAHRKAHRYMTEGSHPLLFGSKAYRMKYLGHK